MIKVARLTYINDGAIYVATKVECRLKLGGLSCATPPAPAYTATV